MIHHGHLLSEGICHIVLLAFACIVSSGAD
jgi:hypothetical protein